jgi:hypothetical protein
MDQNGTIQNAPTGLGKPHCDCRWLWLELAVRNRALEKRARQNRLRAPSLTASHCLRALLSGVLDEAGMFMLRSCCNLEFNGTKGRNMLAILSEPLRAAFPPHDCLDEEGESRLKKM